MRTTVNFGPTNRVLNWFSGGLNFQIEHHLLPKICHVNFPELSKIVEEVCQKFGVKFNEHPTFRAGVASHFRWLRAMGRPTPA
jgi:linoleoyl-CoA desaturase